MCNQTPLLTKKANYGPSKSLGVGSAEVARFECIWNQVDHRLLQKQEANCSTGHSGQHVTLCSVG